MKTLGLSLIFVLLSGLFSVLGAQAQEQAITALTDLDRQILHSWVQKAKQADDARIDNDVLILPSDDRDAMCAFMRIYRVKREFRGSDVTRPAGYTTCVPAARFTMKSTVEVKEEPAN
jgi:hypothetical protein